MVAAALYSHPQSSCQEGPSGAAAMGRWPYDLP